MSARADAGSSIIIGDVPKSRTAIIRVSLNEYCGSKLIDIRLVDSPKEGDDSPVFTKKGVCLRVDRLQHLIHLLQRAQEQATAAGWIDCAARKAA
jgi:hypothetical protein